jgi:hypothetical protein
MKKRERTSPSPSPTVPKKPKLASPLSPGTVVKKTMEAIQKEIYLLREMQKDLEGSTRMSEETAKMIIKIMSQPRLLSNDTPIIRRWKTLYRALRKRRDNFQEALILNGEESPSFSILLEPKHLYQLEMVYTKGGEKNMNHWINLYVNLLYFRQTKKTPPLVKTRAMLPLPLYMEMGKTKLTPDLILRGIFTRHSTTYLHDEKVNLPICITKDLSDDLTSTRKKELTEFLFYNSRNEFILRKSEYNAIKHLVQPNPTMEFHPMLAKAYTMSRANLEKLSIDEIPLYFILTSKSLKHAMVSILFENRVFSVGFGYTGSILKYTTKGEDGFLNRMLREKHLNDRGALYTPDYLLNLFYKKPGTQAHYQYNVVDFGILTKLHMDRIKSFFSKVDDLEFNIGIKVATDGKVVLYKFPTQPKTEQQVKNRELDGSVILVLDQVYSELCFKKKSATMNCAGFVDTVFAPAIDCNLFLGVVHPTHCRKTNGHKITDADMESLRIAFQEGNTRKLLDLLQSIHA